jgi:hypothetical protein
MYVQCSTPQNRRNNPFGPARKQKSIQRCTCFNRHRQQHQQWLTLENPERREVASAVAVVAVAGESVLAEF